MGRTTSRAASPPGAPRWRDTARCLISIGVAAAALGWLVPSAAAGPPAALPGVRPHVSLVGSVTTVGLPSAAAVSRLYVRNDGAGAIRWSVTTEVLGTGSPGVSVRVWVPTGSACGRSPAAFQTGSWSLDVLPPAASLPLCVRVSSDGGSAGPALPRVTVTAAAAAS